ncbi:MAG: hypothetical protein E6Z83_16040 [Pantoea sp.]|nr:MULTISPECIES: hypothetical protein [Pantoea]MDU5782296.1 hypothetical protein [Pantoea sp.]
MNKKEGKVKKIHFWLTLFIPGAQEIAHGFTERQTQEKERFS